MVRAWPPGTLLSTVRQRSTHSSPPDRTGTSARTGLSGSSPTGGARCKRPNLEFKDGLSGFLRWWL